MPFAKITFLYQHLNKFRLVNFRRDEYLLSRLYVAAYTGNQLGVLAQTRFIHVGTSSVRYPARPSGHSSSRLHFII